MVFIWGDRGYLIFAVRFEYKTASEQYLVAKLWAIGFGWFLKNVDFHKFGEEKKIWRRVCTLQNTL